MVLRNVNEHFSNVDEPKMLTVYTNEVPNGGFREPGEWGLKHQGRVFKSDNISEREIYLCVTSPYKEV